MHPAFSEMHPEKSKMHPSLFFGAFFYQNMSTKPTERQGYVPTQIIEKREILTVRVSLSHFYPTLIRQLPSHFCFKTLLWVLAQAPPLRVLWADFSIVGRHALMPPGRPEAVPYKEYRDCRIKPSQAGDRRSGPPGAAAPAKRIGVLASFPARQEPWDAGDS